MTTEQRLNIITEALDDLKGQEIQSIEVGHLTDMMEHIVICTATSSAHAKSLARYLEQELKKQEISILGIEGQGKSDWVLVDTGDIVAHIMLEETRKMYALEKLWNMNTRKEEMSRE